MAETHQVAQGDTMVSIAFKYGFASWERIYNHADNEQLRTLRPDPLTLYPGDEVVIPDKEPEPFSRHSGERHTFCKKSPPAWLRMILEDDEGVPYAAKEYQIEIDGVKGDKKRTGPDGGIEEQVPPNAREGLLELWPDDDDPENILVWELMLGHLDPIETDSGVAARLFNLGYDVGLDDNVDPEQFKTALLRFQADQGIAPVSGELDDQTRQAIRSLHGM